ncbi:hypothetical protein P3S68_014627 [Capsicum galapagoense]
MKKTILPFTPPCSTRIMILKPLMMMTIKSRFLIYSNAFLNTKDFTGGYDDDVASISDTMIVKTDRTSKFPSRLLVKDNEFDSGTMVRSCEGVGLSMSRAVGGWANWDWDTRGIRVTE